MKIEKLQDSFVINSAVAVNLGPQPLQSANTNSAEAANKTGNVAKLSALAERIITDAHALIIEKNPNGSGFIYKSIDRNTGEVVRIWPREEMLGMIASALDSDARGAVINKVA